MATYKDSGTTLSSLVGPVALLAAAGLAGLWLGQTAADDVPLVPAVCVVSLMATLVRSGSIVFARHAA